MTRAALCLMACLVACLAACLVALPARAGEPPAKPDVAAVEACLARVKDNEKKAGVEKDETPGPAGRLAAAALRAPLEPANCIGVVAIACEQRDGTSDGARSQCARREAAVWDQRLNAAYRKALDGMEKDGADNLRKTQRAWIAFRDARCVQAWATDHGSMAAPIQAWCEMELTARQALWMETWTE
ncbi:MAG: lysozyme inhibitor LprI family protein [Methylocystis sp.]|uniref:lysozyme inhibitor LprI family protein n=1 Tax=Methylocystis sp. TaxID=1911079 RepID=UPI003DA3AAC1